MVFVLGMGAGVVVVVVFLLIIATMVIRRDKATNNSSLSAPLHMYYDRNGIFLTDIKVENQPIQVVVDTGSAHLLVSGKDCDTCLSNDGKIYPKSAPQQTGHLVQYGSQQDVVDWHRGKVSLGGHEKPDIEFAVASHRSGSSNYNILGVGRMQQGTRRCFLEHFCEGTDKQASPVTIELAGPRGRLWLSPDLNDHPPVQVLLPMLPPPFYRVQIAAVFVGQTRVPSIMIPLGGLIFDSGSNMLDLPTTLYDFVRPHLDNNAKLEFRITSATQPTQQLAITYGPKQYRWETGDLLVERGTDFQYVVLGSLFMNRMRLRFDPEHNQLGLSLL